ncbi:transcriptional regulator, XRE family [Magnetococcus marinus MC-1]|uniref:Transcriptional regulator, XRE family n=1 Tax=Magnetococcus marinus (strain ATCC BAA-1437 / JCM 17883 / MC-1) TaxID=156889 RepID=A0L7A4_MAGMM|nr:helix-turn-helix domain-containing protein [Magnetococcus marinus]ABK43847.1 transcriptional regulator, XRE family [Magnetococcus marinus MC-1]ABK45063.1 transcriptional regulator, XRE family [Magnetococcus marinus MC-1]ABK45228.1 transcriptional regulator, XRE family [Magnetococcus marinus MC-1]
MADGYNPLPLNIKDELTHARLKPGFSEAYDALEDEFQALRTFLSARKEAGLTQEEIAKRMGTTKSAVSRLESSLGDHKHSPSIATLRKYAKAVGCKLEIKLVPQ